MKQKQPAICLRTADYSETSQVVCFLTRGAGVVRLLAKGAKRPKSSSGGAIDLTSEGDLVFITKPGGQLGVLAEFTETTSHIPLRRDAGTLNAALYMLEVAAESLGEDDPNREVFDLLHSGLARLDRPDAKVPAVLAYFQWRLLRHVGLTCQVRQCVACGQPAAATSRATGGEVWFSSALGGVLCANCQGAAPEKYKLNGATLGGLAALAAAEGGAKVALADKQARGVNRLLAYHIQQQLGKGLKMARHVTDPPEQEPARPGKARD